MTGTAPVAILFEKPPRIRAVARFFGPGKSVVAGQPRRHAKHPRLPGPIEIQATRVLAGVNPQRDDRAAGQLSLAVGRKTHGVPAGERIEILKDRLIALGRQGETAVAGVQRGRLPGRIDPEGIHRHDHERCGRHQSDGQRASARICAAFRIAIRTRFPRPATMVEPVMPAPRRSRASASSVASARAPALKNRPVCISSPT